MFLNVLKTEEGKNMVEDGVLTTIYNNPNYLI